MLTNFTTSAQLDVRIKILQKIIFLAFICWYIGYLYLVEGPGSRGYKTLFSAALQLLQNELVVVPDKCFQPTLIMGVTQVALLECGH
jgi:hypothetical protein